ncbi:MAG: Integral rane sensor signal transduction histidine kinase [Streptosporangiaceae bacterium]|nr:Integral rane sensor signal transduction histidine kinase [Streptosporangiaceae bacterium]
MTGSGHCPTVNNVTTGDEIPPRRSRLAGLPVWLVPLVILFVQVMGSTGADHGDKYGHPHTPLDGFGYALLIGGAVALVARRRHPAPTLLVVGLATLTYYLRGYVLGPSFLAAVAALVAAVTAGHRRAAWATAIGGIGVYLAVAELAGAEPGAAGGRARLLHVERPTLPVVVGLTAWALVVLTATEVVRFRSEKAAEVRRTLAEEHRRRASEERLRMARELHDVLAHNISMINVQAGVALHLMDQQPEPAGTATARTALAAIKEASKEALTEMRSVIGVLRQAGDEAPRTPTAGLGRLEDLAGQARTAGLRVHLEIEGQRRPLPAGVDLAAFRIAQESLTNVTRHARPGAGAGAINVWIRIGYGEHDVSVRVDDDGRGTTLLGDNPGGSGIPGMRERAAALDGEFVAGPRPGGGFQVHARLPVDEGGAG